MSSGPGLANLSPFHYLKMRRCLAAAGRVGADLSANRWPVAARLLDMQHVLESQEWTQPAQFIAQTLAALHPGSGGDLDAAIRDAENLDALLQAQAPALGGDWSLLDQRTGGLIGSSDKYVSTLASALRRSGQTAIRLGAKGFTGGDTLHADANLAEQFQSVVGENSPNRVDAKRFDADVASRIDLTHVTAADVQRWIDRRRCTSRRTSKPPGPSGRCAVRWSVICRSWRSFIPTPTNSARLRRSSGRSRRS